MGYTLHFITLTCLVCAYAETQYSSSDFMKASRDKEHVKHHLEEEIKVKEDMSESEYDFHYFRQYDTDKNHMLDGLEILSALIHDRYAAEEKPPEEGGPTERAQELKKRWFEDLSNIVDAVLKEDDINNDGYLDFLEFMRRRQ